MPAEKSSPRGTVERGTLYLPQHQVKAWTRARRIAREHTHDEDEARELLGRASLLAAEQLLARRTDES
jgi:hypothetical protein